MQPPEPRLRDSGDQQVGLGVADVVAERAGRRRQRRARLGAPRQPPRLGPAEIVNRVAAEGLREMLQALRRMDHVPDRAGRRPRLAPVEEHDRDDGRQAAVRLHGPDIEHVPDKLERRAAIDPAFMLGQSMDGRLAAVPAAEAEDGAGLRPAALAVDGRPLDMHRRAFGVEPGDHLGGKAFARQPGGAGGVGDEQTEEGVVPGAWQGHVRVSRGCAGPGLRPRSLPRIRRVRQRPFRGGVRAETAIDAEPDERRPRTKQRLSQN